MTSAPLDESAPAGQGTVGVAPEYSAEVVEVTVRKFVAAWSEADEQQRAVFLDAACTGDVVHANPLAESIGVEALVAHIGAVTRQLPGHRLVRTSAVEIHHRYVRYSWSFQDPTGRPVLQGINVATLADDSRFSTVVAFFGSPPPKTTTYTYDSTGWSRG